MIHIVIHGVPCGAERTGFAIRIIGNDVNAWNAGHLIHWHMVIGNGTSVTWWKETSVAHDAGSLPHTADHPAGIMA